LRRYLPAHRGPPLGAVHPHAAPPAVITTDPLPLKLKAPASGRIARLLAQDDKPVQPGDVLAEFEAPTSYETIQRLGAVADSAEAALSANDVAKLDALSQVKMPALGEAQPYYNELLQQTGALVILKKQRLYAGRIGVLQEQAGLQARMAVVTKEAALAEAEFADAAERFRANEQLYRDKVISRQEYLDESARMRQRQAAIQAGRRASLQTGVASGEYRAQIATANYERADREATLHAAALSAIRSIRSYAEGWRLQAIVAAPRGGTLYFLRPLQPREAVSAGEDLFAILPAGTSRTARVALPAAGLGKLRTGRRVQIALEAFPAAEYGYLEGTVVSVGALPFKEEGAEAATYRVLVSLPSTLTTTQNFRIPAAAEISGGAKIITADRSLLRRLVDGVAGLGRR